MPTDRPGAQAESDVESNEHGRRQSLGQRDGAVRVAFDVGPLHGHRTGIGVAVGEAFHALTNATEPARIEVQPYLLSLRSRPAAGVRKLPLPAAVAHRWWAHAAPPMDRLLGRPDVVHGTNYVVPPTSCPQLVSVYDCWFLDYPDDATLDVQRAAAVLRRSVDHGAHVVSCSEATSKRVRALLDTDRVTTVLLGLPDFGTADGTWPEELAAHDGHPFVLSLGTVERRKNIPTLIASFARLAGEHRTVRLVLAGAPGNDQRAVDAAIAALAPAARNRVIQLGRVGNRLKGQLLSNATVLAYVSLDEGFGFPLLEAQHVGVPIVASTAGSIPEVAGAAALLSSPTDVDAIAANLHLALTSDAVRTKLTVQAERNLERFSWASTARQLTDLYLCLANGS